MAALALARAVMNDPSDPSDAPTASEPRGPRDAAGLEDEVAQLRQLIRMIGHEVGNSLGPIESLLGSARVILSRQAEAPDMGGAAGAAPIAPPAAGRAPAEALALARLDLVLRTAAERAGHLQSFLSECVRLTRLPDPHPAPADWRTVTDRLRALWPGLSVELPAGHLKATFDVSQIEQVLVNLVKNAHESGGPAEEVRVRVELPAGGGGGGAGTRVTVLDRGRGASDLELEAMSRGGFTTKRGGGGVGLGVCRTLIERHGGRLRIERRSGGRGLSVSFWLP